MGSRVTKISVKINDSAYSIKVDMPVDADTVLVLPLRAFVGAEHFGATRNMFVEPTFYKGSDLRRVLDID